MKEIFIKVILLGQLVFVCGFLFSQEKIDPLNIGDKCPNFTFDTIINSPVSRARLSDFKGKPIILDFWSTTCKGCIASFPKIEALQKKFESSIKIFPIIDEANAEEKVPIFWKKNKITRELGLPCIIDKNNSFINLFPRDGVPHIVWIGGDGIIKAITGSKALTESAILKFINNEPQNLERKPNSYAIIDLEKYFLINGYGGNDTSFNYRSIIAGYIDSLRPVMTKVTNEHGTKIFATNQNVISLYKFAYGNYNKDYIDWFENRDFYNKRVIIEIKKSNLLNEAIADNFGEYDEYLQYKKENLFCYEIVLPSKFSLNEAFKFMVEDLNRFFNISSSIERRKVKCLALIRTSKKDKIKGNTRIKTAEFSKELFQLKMSNCPINILVKYLNNQYKNTIYIFDETKYEFPVDINIDSKNLSTIRESLKKYDLDLIPSERELTMLVLKEN